MKQYDDIDVYILMKHLETAYYEDLEKRYSQKGYKVYKEHKIENNVYVDFVAIKNKEMIIFEIKNGIIKQFQKEKLAKIQEYVQKHMENVKFKMIFLNPPQSKHIEFENLSQIIFDDMSTHGTPDELDTLSTHTRVEEITDLEIDMLEIKDEYIHIQGNGVIEVSLQFGSDSEAEDDDKCIDNVPFTFDIKLTKDLSIEEAEYEFDTDSFYE